MENQNNDYLDGSVILYEKKIQSKSASLKGGKISAFMGSMELYLKDADMAGDSMVLQLSAVMASIEIHIPRHWKVNNRCRTILGYTAQKPLSSEQNIPRTKTLVIEGPVVMASVELIQ